MYNQKPSAKAGQLQLYGRGLLDSALFMNTFARTYLATMEAMQVLDTRLHCVPAFNARSRDELARACDAWLKKFPADLDTPLH